jgi:glycosyltransferase involved in cell wall biosynthesis
MGIDVSVLVPVLDEERHIRQTVAAMQEQEFDGSLEFLFADGGSADGSKAILLALARLDPRIRVFDNPRRIIPSGLNVCLRHARGTYVARMDAHTYYPPSYLADGVARLARGDTSWVSGPQIPTPKGRTSRAVALALGSWLGQGGSRRWKSEYDALDTSAGPAPPEIELDTGVFTGVWRRDTILRFGGWDERWPSNEDSEMAGRFLAAGERLVLLPQMGARYIPRDRLRGVWRQYWGWGHYRVRTWRRHPETMRPSHMLTPFVTVAAAGAVLGPGPLRRLARAGLALYVGAVTEETVRALAGERTPDALMLPPVYATMHFGYGVGVLQGIWRFGPPLAAIAGVLGLSGMRERLTGDQDPVFAPSLNGPGPREEPAP